MATLGGVARLAAVAYVFGSTAGSIACSTRPTDDAARSTAPLASAATAAAPGAPPSTEVNPRLLRRFQPLPASFDDDKNTRSTAKVDLGRMLFFDARLSADGDLSCNSCHALDDYGVDHQRFSAGHGGRRGERNAPTVYNAAGQFAQFWDGRARDVEEQAQGPIVNPIEMAMPDAAHVVSALRAVPGYVTAFRTAFPGEADPVTFDNVGRAIGAFERGLVTPSRWDDYLRGNSAALTSTEKEGLKTFLNVGCMVCHTGTFVGGATFERVGVVEPWPNQKDRGRQQITNLPGDSMMFKVPTLRNVEHTAPYFHDGSAATLEDAVRMMGLHQLGLDMSDAEVASIVSWLKSLTGAPPREYVERPALPRSGT
jgi:cytochrome c peroxidase